MKKTAAAIIGLVLSASLLGGCGAGTDSRQSTETSKTASTTAASEPVTEAATAASEQATEAATAASEPVTEAATAASEPATEAAAAASEPVTEAPATEAAFEEAMTDTAVGSHVLVVYYSATGNTKAVAETIADTVDADIFEITPVDPYTDEDLNWNNDDSRVSREHEDEELQNQVELTTTEVENWDSYDTVFIGYPIWWGNAAWPVNQFIQNNDFTGKTVIPFCTSASSGLGESGKNLEEMAGTGDWQEGRRFSSNPDEADVTAWAEDVIDG